MAVQGKIAFITGGASGMGLQTANLFIKEGIKGVAIVDINYPADEEFQRKIEKEQEEFTVIFLKTDVSDEEQVKNAYKQTIDCFRKIDIVVNAAGIYNDKQWRKEIEINFLGVVHSTLQAFENMSTNKGGEGGTVLNIASVLGLSPEPSVPIYTATKFAVQGLSRSFGHSAYYEKTGIKVITICPGITSTPMYDEIMTNVFDESILIPEEVQKTLRSRKAQRPEDVAKCIIEAYLDGDNGSVWIIMDGNSRKQFIATYEK